jgi:hypothetical protein
MFDQAPKAADIQSTCLYGVCAIAHWLEKAIIENVSVTFNCN